VALAGCGEETDPFIAPGGSGSGTGGSGSGTGGTGGGADAGVGLDGAIARQIHGRICQVDDVRLGADCVAIDGTGLSVRIVESGAQAQVAADGRFTVTAPSGLVTLVTNTNHVVWFGAGIQVGDAGGEAVLPIMSREDVNTLLSQNLITLAPGRGILVVHVTDGTNSVSGAILSDLAGDIAPFYDFGDPFTLAGIGPTGPGGTAVYFNAPPGLATFNLSFAGRTTSYFSFVASDVLSWALAVLPSS
jgi:hypothetical protein